MNTFFYFKDVFIYSYFIEEINTLFSKDILNREKVKTLLYCIMYNILNVVCVLYFLIVIIC